MNETQKIIDLARQKMATAVTCQLCGKPYVEMNLRNPRICGDPKCQSDYRSRPRSVNSNDRQFLTPLEVQRIKNNPEVVTMRGRFADVRGNQ